MIPGSKFCDNYRELSRTPKRQRVQVVEIPNALGRVSAATMSS